MIPETLLQPLFLHFGLAPSDWRVSGWGEGLINATWIVKDREDIARFILQKVNTQVFTQPGNIAHNLHIIGDYLAEQHPDYLFTRSVIAVDGSAYFVTDDDEYYRLFPFVPGSTTLSVVTRPEQALAASFSFARFSCLLSGLDPTQLRDTLPHFHDLVWRYRKFESVLDKSDTELRQRAAPEITYLTQHAHYVSFFQSLRQSPTFPLRVMHHDTKISNILFDQDDRSLCVIDLDTVMPGYFISDLGDMIRTYLSPVSEEEKDLAAIVVRPLYFRAIVTGYYRGMEGALTGEECRQFQFAGQFMIYMQALRFLTDYLEGDVYYGARYEGHNLWRARNQITLLTAFNQATDQWEAILRDVFNDE